MNSQVIDTMEGPNSLARLVALIYTGTL